MSKKKITLLLSIHPRFAQSIFDGSKTVELRRVVPKLSKGDTVVFYAATPISAVVGTATVDGVVSGSPSRIWREVGTHTGVSRREFRAYFAGSRCAYAIKLTDATAAGHPTTLEQLRRRLPSFRPPQNFMYLQAPHHTHNGMLHELLTGPISYS